MWSAYIQILLLVLFSMYNNDHQNGDNVLIPPQIQKDFFWGICRYGSCAHFGNAVGRRVHTIKAHLSRWMGPRFKVHQRTSLIRFLWFGLWLIKRNMWSAFPSSPFHPEPPPPSPSALTHIWRHHTLSLTLLFLPPACGKVGLGVEGERGRGRDEWQVPDQPSFSGSNWSAGGRGGYRRDNWNLDDCLEVRFSSALPGTPLCRNTDMASSVSKWSVVVRVYWHACMRWWVS